MSKTNAKPTETTETVAFNVNTGFAELKTKSALIRHMANLAEFQKDGKPSTGAINKAISDAGIKMRYQHVRNVLTKPLKKA